MISTSLLLPPPCPPKPRSSGPRASRDDHRGTPAGTNRGCDPQRRGARRDRPHRPGWIPRAFEDAPCVCGWSGNADEPEGPARRPCTCAPGARVEPSVVQKPPFKRRPDRSVDLNARLIENVVRLFRPLTSKVATRSHTKRRPHNVGRTLRRRQLARHGASPAPTRSIPPTHPRAPHKNIVIIATPCD